ncbi:MAG: ABC transporter substrate-binding protein, partial [Spirochaetaceae bacterium]|jgi:peptide/nickel transport system substrate-binding protein|nr:ABC transporter substrate-binding protein [Spirochaetaceae bacterium]
MVTVFGGYLFAGGGQQSGSGSTAAGSGLIQGANVPRNETIIIENPTVQVTPADNFNLWGGGNMTYSTGLQQLSCDTLWYIDPDAGLNGVWENALASEKPIYNSDFTQMTVKLRKGIYWSDGIEFTADDLIYTVDIQMKTPGMGWSGAFVTTVDRIEKIDNYTEKTVILDLRGRMPKSAAGQILTSDTLGDHNTFERPDTVRPRSFAEATLSGSRVTLILPPKSVTVLELI